MQGSCHNKLCVLTKLKSEYSLLLTAQYCKNYKEVSWWTANKRYRCLNA